MHNSASMQSRAIAKLMDVFLCLAIGIFSVIFESKYSRDCYLSSAIWVCSLLLVDGLGAGQSPGKRLLKIQVLTKKDGRPCGYFRSVMRNLFLLDFVFIFPALIDLTVMSRSDRRVGDFIAGTVVINKSATM